jgi:hypothetical protein
MSTLLQRCATMHLRAEPCNGPANRPNGPAAGRGGVNTTNRGSTRSARRRVHASALQNGKRLANTLGRWLCCNTFSSGCAGQKSVLTNAPLL